jgi:zinc transport system ATP-binding protein
MSDSLVSVRDLWVHLGGNDILKGLSAEVARGQITALIGLNGSGKTTLLKAILKEIPYTGQIEFRCGHDHRRPTPEHVGYVPQKLRIEANLPLTVRDLLALALQRRPLFLGVSRRVEKLIGEMLDQVGAPRRLLDCYVEKLSGGELQRVLLGLAIHPHPELLLLDEPAAGIDSAGQKPFYDLIGRLNRERGVTVVLVSHDLSMVSEHAHEVICLRDGRIQCHGPPAEISEEGMKQTFGIEMRIYAHRHEH